MHAYNEQSISGERAATRCGTARAYKIPVDYIKISHKHIVRKGDFLCKTINSKSLEEGAKCSPALL